MAFNYYPTYPQYYNPYLNQTPAMGQNQPQNVPQNQQAGIVPVRSEDEARNYPVAPGNSVTFRNETAPYVYTKTMGVSPLDRPVFERYRLIKENEPETTPKQPEAAVDLSMFALKSDVEALRAEIDELKRPKSVKKE